MRLIPFLFLLCACSLTLGSSQETPAQAMPITPVTPPAATIAGTCNWISTEIVPTKTGRCPAGMVVVGGKASFDERDDRFNVTLDCVPLHCGG